MLSAKVSIVIPAFNASSFLVETLRSAVEANPHKVIVVDDGSSDNTFQIAKDFSKTYRTVSVVTKTNGGESSAINYGLRLVETPYVLFLSADDLIDRRLLSMAVRLMDSDLSLVAAYPSWNVISGDGQVLNKVTDIDFSLERLVGGLECLPGPGSVLRTSAIGGGRNESLRQIPDLDQWLRLATIGSLVHIPEVLASWRSHGDNMSHQSFGSQMSMELDVVYETVEMLYGQKGSQGFDDGIWAMFQTNWHRRKAISESRRVGSLKSVIHLFKSWKSYIEIENPHPRNPWTALEIIGTIAPPLVWLRDFWRTLRA